MAEAWTRPRTRTSTIPPSKSLPASLPVRVSAQRRAVLSSVPSRTLTIDDGSCAVTWQRGQVLLVGCFGSVFSVFKKSRPACLWWFCNVDKEWLKRVEVRRIGLGASHFRMHVHDDCTAVPALPLELLVGAYYEKRVRVGDGSWLGGRGFRGSRIGRGRLG